jgi:hypothetical protein
VTRVNDGHDGNSRMSLTSTTDWDKDNNDLDHESPQRQHILQDGWSDSPTRSAHENWDDDFMDSHSSAGKLSFPPPPSRKLGGRSRLGQLQANPRPESWDDELAGVSPSHSRASPSSSRRPRYTSTYSSSSEDEEGAHDPDYRLGEKDEEDQTVTARSRRAALSKLTSTPPPPVPSLPLSLPFLLPPPTSTASPNDTADPQPFPCSPTSSVFSIPLSTRTTTTRPLAPLPRHTQSPHKPSSVLSLALLQVSVGCQLVRRYKGNASGAG